MNINILSWYLLKGKPKKLWTFPKLKLWFQNNNFGPKKHQNYLKKSMDIHVWPTYLLKICPNFFPEKNMASTDPTYLWFGICPKFRSFFFFEGLPYRESFIFRTLRIIVLLWILFFRNMLKVFISYLHLVSNIETEIVILFNI